MGSPSSHEQPAAAAVAAAEVAAAETPLRRWQSAAASGIHQFQQQASLLAHNQHGQDHGLLLWQVVFHRCARAR